MIYLADALSAQMKICYCRPILRLLYLFYQSSSRYELWCKPDDFENIHHNFTEWRTKYVLHPLFQSKCNV